MKGNIFKVVKRSETWEKTGTPPITTKWVDTDKTHGTGAPTVRSSWVAREFKGRNEKHREDFFSATPPIELMRFMCSRQATWRDGGKERKTLYLEVKKAHLNPKSNQDVYMELSEEARVVEGKFGKLIHWLYGCRQAAQAWEEHYSALLGMYGFKRLLSVPTAFVHTTRILVGVVHRDGFIFVGIDEDLDYVLGILQSQYALKNRGRLGTRRELYQYYRQVGPRDRNRAQWDLMGGRQEALGTS